jgi:hypothetical protein
MKFYEMKTSEIRTLKEKLWLKNSKKCPVLNKEIPLEKMALDHAHKNSNEEYSETKGVIREALDFRVNAVLGKLENSLKRTGLTKDDSFNISDFLRRAADYFEKGAYKDEFGVLYIHPSEVKKEPILPKSNYNKLKKVYHQSNKRAKFPEYPKNSKLTKKLSELFKEFNIEPYHQSSNSLTSESKIP